MIYNYITSMRQIGILIILLVAIVGVAYIGSGIDDVQDDDVGDNQQNQTDKINEYDTIKNMTSAISSALPYALLLLVVLGALLSYKDLS